MAIGGLVQEKSWCETLFLEISLIEEKVSQLQEPEPGRQVGNP